MYGEIVESVELIRSVYEGRSSIELHVGSPMW